MRLSGPRKVLFLFAPSPSLDADVAAFTEQRASIDPMIYDTARIALRRDIEAMMGGAR